MGALVKLSLTNRNINYLRLDLAAGIERRNTSSGMGVELLGSPSITKLTGEDAGQEIVGPIKANSKVIIHLGEIRPTKYQTFIESNPILAQYGTVGHPRIVEPGDRANLGLFFRADKQIDISELKWLLRIYLID